MAATSSGEVSDPPEINFKCCKNKKVNQVSVCMICGGMYHSSCIERRKCVRLDNTRIICCQRKITYKEKDITNYTSIEMENYLLLELVHQLKQHLKTATSNIGLEREDVDCENDSNNTKDGLKSVYVENNLLKQLVQEMKDKNKLLTEKIEQIQTNNRGGNDRQKMWWSDVCRNGSTNSQYTETSVASLIVKPKKQQPTTKTKDDIQSNINPAEMKIGISDLIETKSGKVIIKCQGGEDLRKLEDSLVSKLAASCDIYKEEPKRPVLKIVGINKKYAEDELGQMLRSQNGVDEQEILRVNHIRSITGRDTYTAFVEVSPRLFAKFASTGKILVGWQRCLCFEDLNLNRCSKCKMYRHKAAKCRDKLICGYCAQEHLDKDCQESQKQCVNCSRANQKFRKNYDVHHSVYDIKNCDSYKQLEKNERLKINYRF